MAQGQFGELSPARLAGMSEPATICVLGAGLAGGYAVGALREAGYQGRVLLVGAEGEPPYDRPPLSKSYLTGQMPLAKLWLRPSDYYRQHAIELVSGPAVSLDPQAHRVGLAGGDFLSYERLLITTGSSARDLAVAGAQLDGVQTVRTLADADRLRDRLASRPRVLVVGAGFLGCELAAAARTLGCEVLVAEAAAAPLGALGAPVSRFVLELHRGHGVEIECSTTISEFRGRVRLEGALLGDGRLVACELALVCVGATPCLDLAVDAGLAVDGAIPVDRSCRSADPSVFAAGDVAAMWHEEIGRRLRLEHWDNAIRQGPHAARAMLDDPSPYSAIPYFWSEQYHAMLQQVGLPEAASELVLRSGDAADRFSLFGLTEGVVVSCVTVNQFRDLTAARRLIGSRQQVASSALADPEVDLRALAAGTPSLG
jgi:3-phenylpropionate/trans-cinnamate dioxygenase ferredoxin reductase subunit